MEEGIHRKSKQVCNRVRRKDRGLSITVRLVGLLPMDMRSLVKWVTVSADYEYPEITETCFVGSIRTAARGSYRLG